jgi:hypothetical protein
MSTEFVIACVAVMLVSLLAYLKGNGTCAKQTEYSTGNICWVSTIYYNVYPSSAPHVARVVLNINTFRKWARWCELLANMIDWFLVHIFGPRCCGGWRIFCRLIVKLKAGEQITYARLLTSRILVKCILAIKRILYLFGTRSILNRTIHLGAINSPHRLLVNVFIVFNDFFSWRRWDSSCHNSSSVCTCSFVLIPSNSISTLPESSRSIRTF